VCATGRQFRLTRFLQVSRTTNGTHSYVFNSQTRPLAAERAGLVRFKLNAQIQKVEGVESIGRLKSFPV
jgi:hypothetical protein